MPYCCSGVPVNGRRYSLVGGNFHMVRIHRIDFERRKRKNSFIHSCMELMCSYCALCHMSFLQQYFSKWNAFSLNTIHSLMYDHQKIVRLQQSRAGPVEIFGGVGKMIVSCCFTYQIKSYWCFLNLFALVCHNEFSARYCCNATF